ncbi:GSCOCG00001732001-RA-CDS [Cotesia congregata]|uniref:Similar to Orct: Organic cation transporter protein (Drosophila melanogaster) n=1 Tax=Cotesia congregata TaxID=51543 RepID=A0A8J2MZA8_COTCN|nr:GSCOCG00001732001-RA-CDS [Cotesia congregata]CAG5107099.1 Similar to Orct: Organic cation transporter protein (Drosophila melanogaster) [Cotesia congregata]
MEKNERTLVQEKCLLQAVDKLGEGSKIVWIVFFINIFTLILYGLNSMSYVYIAEIPEFQCSIPELTNANWTKEQINEISIVDSCQKYNYNYTHLANLGYNKTAKYIKELKLPSTTSCESFIFDDSVRSTVVDEWQLVCDKKLHRANTFSVYAAGIIVGSAFFGTFADIYGRKTSLIISIKLQIISGPVSALVPWFWVYMTCRFFTGMSLGGMFSSAYTILSEIAKGRRREVYISLLDAAFSIGTFFLIGMAYVLPTWRQLQLGISCFIIPMTILIWWIPESPRWLVSQNRHDEAQKIIEKYCGSLDIPPLSTVENSTVNFKSSLLNKKKDFFYRNFKSLRILFTDFRKKILIMYFISYTTAAVCYSLIFNVDNFSTDRHLFMIVVAVEEIIAHLTILVVFIFLSSRKSLALAYLSGSVLLMSILVVPVENKKVTMGLVLATKFFVETTFTSSIALNSELFPSNIRNTALGTCVVLEQMGSLTAPYIVDLLGDVVWWAPTLLCCILSLLAGLFCCIMPSTNLSDENKSKSNKKNSTAD